MTYPAHTYTHLTALCPGLPRWAGTRKVKTNLDFTEARDSEWQWHQLGHMQSCTSLQTDNHASTEPLSFLQAGCPSCRPTNSVKALKALNDIPGTTIKTVYTLGDGTSNTVDNSTVFNLTDLQFCTIIKGKQTLTAPICLCY